MAHTLTEYYIYPPGYENKSPDQRVGTHRVCVRATGISDDATPDIVDRDIVVLEDFRSTNGNPVTRTAIDKITYSTTGVQVKLEWQRNPHTTIAVLPSDSSGEIDWAKFGGNVDPSDGQDDNTGNIILSTEDFDTSINNNYDITIELRLKDNAPVEEDGDE